MNQFAAMATLVQVVDAGSLSGAARAMAGSLTSVSRQLSALERHFGTQLVKLRRLPDSQLVARKLADIQMIVCPAPAYLAQRGIPGVPGELCAHDCLVFADAPGAGSWRFGTNARGMQNSISAKLWINGLDALVAAAREGGGIVRVPSWQARDNLAAGRLQRILREHEPAPAALHLLFEASRLAAPKTRIFADYLIEQWRASDPFGA